MVVVLGQTRTGRTGAATASAIGAPSRSGWAAAVRLGHCAPPHKAYPSAHPTASAPKTASPTRTTAYHVNATLSKVDANSVSICTSVLTCNTRRSGASRPRRKSRWRAQMRAPCGPPLPHTPYSKFAPSSAFVLADRAKTPPSSLTKTLVTKVTLSTARCGPRQVQHHPIRPKSYTSSIMSPHSQTPTVRQSSMDRVGLLRDRGVDWQH